MTWPPAPETLRYLLLRFSQVFPFSCPIFGREPHACRFTVTVYPDRCHLLPDYPIRSCQHIRRNRLTILDSYSVQSENLSLTYSCCQKVDDFLNRVISSAIRGL